MRHSMGLFALLVVVIVGAAVPASAQLGAAVGSVSIVFSAGTDKAGWEASLVLKGARSGKHLFPANGIIQPWRGEDVVGQIIFTRDDRGNYVKPADFEIAWATRACPDPKQMTPAVFCDEAGWTFVVPASCIRQGIMDTPFVLLVKVVGGKKDYVRVIFKFTYDKDPIFQQKLLWISPIDPPQPTAPVVQPKMETRESVDPVKLQEALADIRKAFEANLIDHEEYAKLLTQVLEQIGGLSIRMDRAEAWINQAIAASRGTTSQPAAPATVAPSNSVPMGETQTEQLLVKYSGRVGVVFALRPGSAAGSYRIWTNGPGRKWTAQPAVLTLQPGEEKVWSRSVGTFLAQGYTQFGVTKASANGTPGMQYPLDPNSLRVIILGGE